MTKEIAEELAILLKDISQNPNFIKYNILLLKTDEKINQMIEYIQENNGELTTNDITLQRLKINGQIK